jgi:hypothetical protein
VNQTVPSDFTTTSFGEFSRLPSKLSASTLRDPSCSIRLMQRPRCSQATSRPWRSTVWPFWFRAGDSSTDTAPFISSQRITRSFGMSDQTA